MNDCVKINIKHNTIIFPRGTTEEDVDNFYKKLKELPVLLDNDHIKFPQGTSDCEIKAYYIAASKNWNRDILPPYNKEITLIEDNHPYCTYMRICGC